jgi:hypothetical protein
VTELPIACTLIEAEIPARRAEIAALGERLLSHERNGRRAVLRFQLGDGTRARLEALVAAESRCCAFLQFALTEDNKAISLAIDAPPGAVVALDELAGAFSPS